MMRVQSPLADQPRPAPRHLARCAAAALLASVLLARLAPTPAEAVVHPATVLDGPTNDIIEVDGAAMAADGTGGVVYRKQVGGVAHVFVVPFSNGTWRPPVEVDNEDAYGASMPAIAAGDGGRLLVVWVQPRNVDTHGITLYELVGATMEPGASAFGQAIIVDPNVGEPYTGDVSAVDPSLAMTPRSGKAYVVYRVIKNDCLGSGSPDPLSSACPTSTTDKLVEVRVARFNYLTWSSLGHMNRAPQVAMRNPTPSNAPSIGIDLDGNGLVAWQEPGADGVARIWARRLFGAVPGNVLQASPEQLGGHPITSDADAPAVAMSPYGEAEIAYRIDGAVGSAVATTQLYLNSIGREYDLHASQLTGPTPVAGVTQSGVPSAAIDARGDLRVTWIRGGTAQELSEGAEETPGTPLSIGTATSEIAPTTINPGGGGTTAWLASAGGRSVVGVREDYAGGAFQVAQLAGGIPGAVGGLSLGGSGQGDALIGWTQGPPGRSEVVGDFVQAPPARFLITTPKGWVRGGQASVSWEAAPVAVAGVTYSVYVDGQPRLRGLTGLSAQLNPVGLGDGVHRVQVLALDTSGQQTMSPESELKIDANPPTVALRRVDRDQGVRVFVSDRASGVAVRATRIYFGDGRHANGRVVATHRYRSAGLYTITAEVRDRVGNHAVVHLRVRVR